MSKFFVKSKYKGVGQHGTFLRVSSITVINNAKIFQITSGHVLSHSVLQSDAPAEKKKSDCFLC